MSPRIERIKLAVERAAEGPAVHIQSVPVREDFHGMVVWEGVVEVFSLQGHPTLNRCYGWSFQDDQGETQFVTVLERPPVSSPQTAVKAYVAATAPK